MSTPEPPTLDELKELVRDSNKALSAASDPAWLYGCFRLLVDDKKGRNKWQALRSEKQLDRDNLVLSVWSQLEAKHQREIIEQYHSLEYHRLWLFEWLLRRYDIRRAREAVGGKGRVAQNAHLFLLVAVLAVFALRLKEWLDGNEWAFVFCLIVYLAVLIPLACSFRSKLPDPLEAFAVATHSLIPRLAGAGAVGLVILASSQELLKVVVATNWWWLGALFLAGYGYLLLEMARRVHPMPHPRRLLAHGRDVAATALAHSMTLGLLAEGGLRKVLAGENGNPADPFSVCQLLSIIVFVFTIGLVVNLIWAEQPVTEPL